MANLPEFFGLDLGNESIKVIKIKEKRNSFQIQNIASKKIEANLLQNQSTEGIKKIGDEIKSVMKEAKIRTDKCVTSLPESGIFSRMITLPKVEVEEQDESIHWSIKSLVPIPIENLNVSYLKIRDYKQNEKQMVDWYAVAAKKEMVNQTIEIAKAANLKLLAVETEALSTTRTLSVNFGVKQDILIVDFGAENTNLIIARNGVVAFSQTIGTGSDALTKVIAADFGLTDEDAEKYKISYGMDPQLEEGKIAIVLQPLVNIIIEELKRTMSYYQSKIGGSNLAGVYLTGGGSKLPKFDDYIRNAVGIETILADQLPKIELPKKLKEDPDFNMSSYNVAIGLALKGQEVN